MQLMAALSISSNKKQQETMSEVPAWSLTATDLEDLPPLLGRSDSQKNAYRTALIYMNRYAVTEKKYPKLNQMTKAC